ncbi:Lrp/AsnC family transcriptional regulator [Marmoricola sp. URHB0036]|uniref:Lrp/AsnC family transcriptional regulator n=1 Tax=Marmoricola sp. URHB0036 TaxID=1298863 RepID=UPI0004836E0E|nr:Lrp/AsnC family transcriptional regulator [Marmoricola sp. URHB0036]
MPNENSGIDATNRRVLAELAENPRLSTADLARRIGMSSPSVRERVRRLEESGVIRGYRLDIDPAAMGVPIAAWVRVRPGPGQLPKVAELAQRTPQVSQCYRISGEDCFLMLIHVPTIEGLESILDQFLMHGQTTSSFVVATPVPPRPILDPGVRGE